MQLVRVRHILLYPDDSLRLLFAASEVVEQLLLSGFRQPLQAQHVLQIDHRAARQPLSECVHQPLGRDGEQREHRLRPLHLALH